MSHPPSSRHGVLLASMALATLPAWAGPDCEAPLGRWQSREAVRQAAAAKGWQIQRLKIDDGCYEISGTDAQGRSFKARLDPETLAVLKLKSGEGLRERARDHEHDGAARAGRPPPSNAASAPSPEPGPRR
ncbi:PepSY domain-containing protein [Ramlibacter sp.]|uniref:PepSY domain-containing protein n=1 Tax=Ramlibacter sp. TaxID=1917967 RepID=UPI0035AEC521